MLPPTEIDKNALLQEVLTKLTEGGETEVSWQAIEALLGQKIAALGGDATQAVPYIQQVSNLEQDN